MITEELKEQMVQVMQETLIKLDAKAQVVSYINLHKALTERFPDLASEDISEVITDNTNALISVIEAQRLIK